MATIRLPPDFKEFFRSLDEHHVEYLLIGGYAVGYHGYPRATADLDIWVANDPENAQRMVACLRDFGFDVPHLSVELLTKKDVIVRMGVPPIRIEVMTSISGVTFRDCYNERVVGNLDGVTVSLISSKHLKINKKASGRHTDLNDLEDLP